MRAAWTFAQTPISSELMNMSYIEIVELSGMAHPREGNRSAVATTTRTLDGGHSTAQKRFCTYDALPQIDPRDDVERILQRVVRSRLSPLPQQQARHLRLLQGVCRALATTHKRPADRRHRLLSFGRFFGWITKPTKCTWPNAQTLHGQKARQPDQGNTYSGRPSSHEWKPCRWSNRPCTARAKSEDARSSTQGMFYRFGDRTDTRCGSTFSMPESDPQTMVESLSFGRLQHRTSPRCNHGDQSLNDPRWSVDITRRMQYQDGKDSDHSAIAFGFTRDRKTAKNYRRRSTVDMAKLARQQTVAAHEFQAAARICWTAQRKAVRPARFPAITRHGNGEDQPNSCSVVVTTQRPQNDDATLCKSSGAQRSDRPAPHAPTTQTLTRTTSGDRPSVSLQYEIRAGFFCLDFRRFKSVRH